MKYTKQEILDIYNGDLIAIDDEGNKIISRGYIAKHRYQDGYTLTYCNHNYLFSSVNNYGQDEGCTGYYYFSDGLYLQFSSDKICMGDEETGLTEEIGYFYSVEEYPELSARRKRKILK